MQFWCNININVVSWEFFQMHIFQTVKVHAVFYYLQVKDYTRTHLDDVYVGFEVHAHIFPHGGFRRGLFLALLVVVVVLTSSLAIYVFF